MTNWKEQKEKQGYDPYFRASTCSNCVFCKKEDRKAKLEATGIELLELGKYQFDLRCKFSNDAFFVKPFATCNNFELNVSIIK